MILTIRDLAVRAVRVPLRRPLRTAGGTIGDVPLLLLDLRTQQGITGRAYLFCYGAAMQAPMRAILADAATHLAGEGVAPLAADERLRRAYRLIGHDGLISSTLAGLDVAAWDALAQAAELPLVRFLGGAPQPVAAYNSNGLGVGDPAALPDEAAELVAVGFSAVKLRLGYRDAAADVAAVRAVRARIGDGVRLMADYNQGLSVADAIERGRALDGEGLTWIEEPTRFDDDAGNAAIARALATPVMLGENWIGPPAVQRALAAGVCDYAMFDLQRIGGVTGWLRAAALAQAAGMPVSSHLFPEVSAHLLALTPTRHWLEYVDWAAPILATPLEVRGGMVTLPTAPGSGVRWDEDAVARYTVAV